jgi:hypothetical protein
VSGAKGLVVLHVDGLSARTLEKAVRDGKMPFTRELIEREGYAIHPYRCGLPSTTPFAQAGILYGDNSEIPSFRWWDREQEVAVQFGAMSTFKKIAHRYFKDADPFTKDGACIAACYPAGAADDFGIAYHDRKYGAEEHSRSALRTVVPYLLNPVHLGDWAGHTLLAIGRTVGEYVDARSRGRRPARAYVISDALEEIFVHHLTRFAVEQAMDEGYAPIYAGFYAFDETAHAFGPDDDHTLGILDHVDHTIAKIAARRRGRYELLVLSDHGQVPMLPFDQRDGVHFGELVAGWLPGFHVDELKGKGAGPKLEEAGGLVRISYSGGLAHVYAGDARRRLDVDEVRQRLPGFIERAVACERIALVMGRRGDRDVLWSDGEEVGGERLLEVLGRYDDPRIVREQLARLNSFEASGDLVLFAEWDGDRQINFENQAGGHGSIGGEQLHPFVLARDAWGIDTSRVTGAHEIHPILCRLRDALRAGASVAA